MIRLLTRLKVLDADGTLSISHIAFFSCLVLILAHPSWETIVPFSLSVANFNGKKWFAFLRARKELGDQEKLSLLHAEIKRQREDIDNVLSAMSFQKLSR